MQQEKKSLDDVRDKYKRSNLSRKTNKEINSKNNKDMIGKNVSLLVNMNSIMKNPSFEQCKNYLHIIRHYVL